MKKFLVLLFSALFCLSACTAGEGNIPDDSTIEVNIKTEIVDTSDYETDAPTPPEDVVKKASFVGCGDNIIYYGTWRDANKNANWKGYDFTPMYDNVREQISAADIAFINQECVSDSTREPSSYPGFNCPTEVADALVEVGFDVVSLANNHMLDQGPSGLANSYNYWLTKGVTLLGCHEENDRGIYVTYTETNGIKIAYVSYTYGTNLGGDPADYGLYASYLKYADVEGEIGEARANSDFVIVSVHWGEEGHTQPSAEQRSYAQLMADSGADVIIGHHPHVIQPVEWIEGKDGNKTLCYFSLGNFLHEQNYQYNIVGGMACFNIVKTNDGHAVAEDVQFIPTACHYPQNFYGNTVYYLSDYNESLASQHAVRTYYNHECSFSYMVDLVVSTIKKEYLPEWYLDK